MKMLNLILNTFDMFYSSFEPSFKPFIFYFMEKVNSKQIMKIHYGQYSSTRGHELFRQHFILYFNRRIYLQHKVRVILQQNFQ